MKPWYFLVYLFIFLSASSMGYSQPKDSQPKFGKYFSMRNGFYKAAYNGRNGRSGSDGSGRIAIVLFRMAKRGGHGKHGHPGPTLQVKVSAVHLDDSVILEMAITKEGRKKTKHYYVNPRHGIIAIFADGGNGGDGGNGQDGPDVTEKHPYGNDGGNGGNGADGGDGGTINVTFDSSSVAYVNCPCILYYNRGGIGGHGGEGGRPSGSASATGSPGNSGGAGSSGPPVNITGPSGKIMRIVTDTFH